MRIGIVKEIYRFPVKSMAGERLDHCAVGTLGITGDRGWAIRDEKTREITEGTFSPLLMQCAAHYREAPAPGFVPIVRDANQRLGIYASVVSPGTVRVGDVVELG